LSYHARGKPRSVKLVRLFRRLFSTFPRGWPGTGLLLMRVVAGFVLIGRGITGLTGELSLERIALYLLAAAGTGSLLVMGLWTPLVGALAAVIELWLAFSQPGDHLTHILLATMCTAVAMVGPGGWSVDARLFGWKRIDIRSRPSQHHPL
jgi:putative oxidoreductase